MRMRHQEGGRTCTADRMRGASCARRGSERCVLRGEPVGRDRSPAQPVRVRGAEEKERLPPCFALTDGLPVIGLGFLFSIHGGGWSAPGANPSILQPRQKAGSTTEPKGSEI